MILTIEDNFLVSMKAYDSNDSWIKYEIIHHSAEKYSETGLSGVIWNFDL